MGSSKKNYSKSVTFLISLVSMHLSILKTVDISICSLEMELSQVVKLSTVARKRTQVNFKILNILLMILSRRKKKKHNFKGTKCHFVVCSSDALPEAEQFWPTIPHAEGARGSARPEGARGGRRPMEAATATFSTCSASIQTKPGQNC